VQLSVAARTDVGRIRAGNEDSLFADATPSRGLFIVADGMGGHAAGEVASEMAVAIVGRSCRARSLEGDAARRAWPRRCGAPTRPSTAGPWSSTTRRGMGTTASVLLLSDTRYLIGQVGDSRVYVLRDGTLRQLTRDHSYVQEQVDAGYLTPSRRATTRTATSSRAASAPTTRSIPDVFAGPVRPGDVFLVASDGLTGMVDDRRCSSSSRRARRQPASWTR
jgi:protein phosphatase